MMCCYYPTRVVAIDDDADFLKTLKQYLGLSNYDLFSSPEEAINSVINRSPLEQIKSRLLNSKVLYEDANPTPENFELQVDLKKLHEEIYRSDRFDDVSVLIVDYHMGEISGIDLCQKLSHHPSKKILLTGGSDKEKVAIEAFNKGIIDRFINKSDTNFPTQLQQTITVLKETYFIDLTKMLFPSFPAASINLLNSAYINFIYNIKKDIDAVEYYLLDTAGSTVFIDRKGTPNWLVIKHDRELDAYEQIAINSDSSDRDECTTIINAINNRSKIPFFFSEEDLKHPVQNWNEYLYESKKLPGLAGFYYALISGHIHNNIDKKRQTIYSNDSVNYDNKS